MTPADVLDLLRLAIWTVMIASAPAVLSAMFIGTAIAVLQALTQVQEVTLTFVPKIIAVLLALSITSVFIGTSIQDFTEQAYARIATSGR